MSSQDYYSNQHPQPQQGYGGVNPSQDQWQAGQAYGYSQPPHQSYAGDQSYTGGYEQNRAYEYNSPPPNDYQQPYQNQGGYQDQTFHQGGYQDQFQHNSQSYHSQQGQYSSSGHYQYSQQGPYPPSHNQYTASAPDGLSYEVPSVVAPSDHSYSDQIQRSYSPHPGPMQGQYDNYTAPPAAHGGMNTGYVADQNAIQYDPNNLDATQDRGVMGALAGGAVGGFAGHKVHHGFMGAVGGAIAGSLAEDALKKKKKEKKHKPAGMRRDSSSSSSSSSSDDDKKKKKKYGLAGAGAAGAGALAYAHGNHDQKGHGQPVHAMRGNFSASSTQITLDRDYDLIASCSDVHSNHKLSSISLNQCLTNSNGHLAWYRGGNFGASARNVRLIEGGRVLEAELGDGRGGWNRDRIRLDERISNSDGELVMLD